MVKAVVATKDTLILHIGMHKTATKSIQAGLNGYSDGVTRYARLGVSNHSIPIMTAFRRDPSAHLYYRKRGVGRSEARSIGEGFRKALFDELRSPERNLIVSGEELCSLTAGEVERIRDFFEAHCRRLRVLAYVREPIGFASSAFQQVARHRELKELRVPAPNYRRKFEKYIEVFGRSAVEFVLFDPAALREGCIITDFCDRVGIAAENIKKMTRNQSLSNTAVALLLEWNRHGLKGSASPAEVKATNSLIALLRQEFQGKFRLDPELVETCVDRADCDWMENQAGFAFASADRARDGTGIRCEADLAALVEAALPRLKEIVASESLRANGGDAASLLDALYRSRLESRV